MRKVSFNYATLSDSHRGRAKAAAEEIRALEERIRGDSVRIGQLLTELHALLGPKVFATWVRAEIGYQKSAAYKYMRIARFFGKVDCADRFVHSAMLDLASDRVPDAARDEAIDEARAGKTVTHLAAIEIIERHERAAPRRQLPALSKSVTGLRMQRARSALTLALTSCPAGEREQVARDLERMIRTILADLAGDGPIARAPAPTAARSADASLALGIAS